MTQRVRIFLVTIAVFLNGNVLSPFMDITKDFLGFGFVWPMIALAGILTCVFFKVPLRIALKNYGRNQAILIPITLSVFYCLSFLPIFLFPMKSLKVVLSFILSIYVGWNIIGGLLVKDPSTIYKNILTILYTGALIVLITVSVSILLNSSEYPGLLNMDLANLGAAGRFRGGTNAVATGYGIVFLILITFNWIISSKSLVGRLLLLVVCAYFFYFLLSTLSRGPVLTLAVIVAIFLFSIIMSGKRAWYIKIISMSLLVLSLVLVISKYDLVIKPFFISRSFHPTISGTSLAEGYISARQGFANNTINVADSMEYDKFFGAGPGADAEIASRSYSKQPIIESFFIAMIFNWGVIGGLLYIFGMAALSYQVIKMERIERARGNKHAWLATAWILIPWVSSPFGYGFGLAGGSLSLTFAIGAAASAYCKSYATVSKRDVMVRTHEKKIAGNFLFSSTSNKKN